MAHSNNAYEVHKETDAHGVTYTLFIERDDTPVRGNAMASGDDKVDHDAEVSIIRRLNLGQDWAWAHVIVEASFEGFTGDDHLGCCSYRNTEEFIQPGGYWDDMKAESRRMLEAKLQAAEAALVKWRVNHGQPV